MTKDEFIKKLRKKLEILEDSEIEDIVSEYTGYIEEKVNRGLSEEEAINELGDLNEIVSDLLAAYKVKEPKKESGFNSFINKVSKYIDAFMDSLSEKSAKDILRLIVELVLILILIGIMKFPFSILKDFGWDLFHELAYPIGKTFYSIWAFIIELVYFILAVVMFIKIIDKRYFKGLSEKIIDYEEEAKNTVKKKKENRETVNEKKVSNTEKQITEREEKIKPKGFLDTLTDICLVFLKVIAFFCLLGVIGYLIGMAFAIGIMIYFLISGVKYFGVAILLIAMFLGGILLLELGVDFIFNKRVKAWSVFGTLLTIIVLTGFGLTLGAVEIADTEIIYESNYKTKTISKEIKMREDLTFYYYDEMVIDNTLKDTVRIEYQYPDISKDISLEIDLENCYRGYCLSTKTNHIRLSKDLLDYVVEGLKDKKIYVYDYAVKKIIYVNKENYKIINENRRKNNYSYEREEEIHTLTKIYQVDKIEEDTNELYLNLTIYDEEINDKENVRISKSLANGIEAFASYEFTFEYRGDAPDNDIEEIFDECKLIDIKKKEINQIQDEI